MNIALASDHAGYDLKSYLTANLTEHTLTDLGTYSTESTDYPEYGHRLADVIESGKADFGIAICGSGNGINMTVNKHRGIRGALCWSSEIARLARAHNDANIISLPARFLNPEEALLIVRIFLNTPFEGGRHEQRKYKIPLS